MMRSQRCVEEKKRKRASQEEEDEEEAAYITADLYTEILSWLPSVDLLTFKRVCKDWLQLISSPNFIQKHLERSKSCLNGASILIPGKNDTEILDLAKSTSKKIPWSDVHLLGSCDGLVLCWLHDREIAAVNPSTGKSVIGIPNEYVRNEYVGLMICSWFGHHPSTGEYVLVLARMSAEPFGLVFEVYSLSRKINILISSSVEQLKHLSFYFSFQKIGTLLHGRLHCPTALVPDMSDRSETAVFEAGILVYDFQTNKIIRMGTPENWKEFSLGVVDGCVSAFRKGAGMLHFELWIMKEYGVKESWTKYANIEGFDLLNMLTPLAICPIGDAILTANFFKFTKYLFPIPEETLLVKAYGRNGKIACVDSLVSPALVWREGKIMNS